MPITVKNLIDRISRDLIDLRNVRWSRPELIDFMNDAIAAIVIRRPDLSRATWLSRRHRIRWRCPPMRIKSLL